MKIIKNIAGRIFAFWALIIFIITMFVAFILIWIVGAWKEPKRTILFQRISRIWMRIFFFLTGLRISLKGKEHFKKGETYIVVCNHNSLMDVPLTTPFIPGANKTIAKIEMAKIPLFGLIYKRGAVLVDRKNEESRKNSFLLMKEVLDTGLHMCIYPEGTRNKTKEPLQAFHSGAFRLAIDTGKAILPAVIFNTAKVLPVHKSFFFWPVKVKMHFLEPVEPGTQTLDQLKEKVFTVMKEYYVSYKD
ncbi:MAG TPA: lysophospholipid acyltransferase family protein [Chitinophagaceae bacterium]|nr:lysophospholipid acyltransferase family protein [Chitinophagaceae bacterium]